MFLTECLKQKIIPHSLLPFHLRYTDTLFPMTHYILLKDRIKTLQWERETVAFKLRNAKRKLHHSFPSTTVFNFYNTISNICVSHFYQRKRNLDHKLEVIFNKSKWVTKSNPLVISSIFLTISWVKMKKQFWGIV